MIVYFDTSALVPLLVKEPGSDVAGELWDAADEVVTARIAYVEAVAALSLAQRLGRIGTHGLKAARGVLDELWDEINIVEVDQELVSTAADLAIRHELRGYDAVHCAGGLAVRDDHLVAAAGDKHLLAAWHAVGVSTVNTAASPRP